MGVVVLPEGANLNEELIRQGHAWVYPQYCKQDFCSDWQGLEEEAREDRAGLWFSDNVVAPWEWRKVK